MGCENRKETDPIEKTLEIVEADSRTGKLLKRRVHTARLRAGARSQVVTPASNSVDTLGKIHNLKENREGADKAPCILDFGENVPQFLLSLCIALTPANGGTARGFNLFEKALAGLFLDDLTDECAKDPDVFTQPCVFEGKVDIAVVHSLLVRADSVIPLLDRGENI
jgi:hypothetical protein